MSCRMLIAALATAAAILPGHAGPGQAPARSSHQPDLAAYDQGVAAAARSDRPRAPGSRTAARPTCSGTRSRSTARSCAPRPTARTAIRTTR
jgi:hypothetical protein